MCKSWNGPTNFNRSIRENRSTVCDSGSFCVWFAMDSGLMCRHKSWNTNSYTIRTVESCIIQKSKSFQNVEKQISSQSKFFHILFLSEFFPTFFHNRFIPHNFTIFFHPSFSVILHFHILFFNRCFEN